MTYNIRISKQAKADIRRAVYHYESVYLADDYLSDLNTQIQYIRQNPYLFQIYYRRIRKCHFKRFPYSIHYTISDSSVDIFRVIHQKQYVAE